MIAKYSLTILKISIQNKTWHKTHITQYFPKAHTRILIPWSWNYKRYKSRRRIWENILH